jgi:hypothetical protein
VLYSRDLGAERESRGTATRRLLKEPFRTFEVLADGAILTAVDREDAFGSVIRLHDPAGGTSEALLVTDLLVSDIVADAGNVFVAARADWNNARVYRVSIPGWTGRGECLSGVNPAAIRLEQLHDTPFQEAELCLAEGRLFYSATYGAKCTLYEYEIDSGVVYRSVSSDFARSPAWDEENRTLYYIGLNAEGEDLYREKASSREIAVPGVATMTGIPAADARASGVPTAAELEIPDAVVRRGGYWDNLATLRPRAFFPVELSFYYPPLDFQVGAGIAGTSALGDFQYVVLGYYDSLFRQSEVEASLWTTVLAPLIMTFELEAAADSMSAQLVELALTLELPLYRRLGKGFSYFALGTTGILGQQSPTLEPYTVLGFQGAASQALLTIAVQWQEDTYSPGYACLLLPGLDVSVVFLGAELSLQGSSFFDLLDDFWDFPRDWLPPGYESPLSGIRGGAVFATLSIPLLHLRGGLWNPGLYFGDVFIEPFLNAAFNDQELQLSYGGTLHLEMKTGARDEGFLIDLYAGLGMTRDGLFLRLFGFEIVGYGGGYTRGTPGGRAPQPVLRQ